MRIPVSPLPTGPVASPAPAVRVPEAAFGGNIGRAVTGLAEQGLGIVADQQDIEARREDEAIRSRDAAAVLQYENDVLTAADEIKRGLADGTVKFDAAEAQLSERIKDLGGRYQPQFSKRYADVIGLKIQGVDLRAGRDLSGPIETARRGEVAANFATTLDALSKQAGRPGADVAALSAQAEAVATTLGKQAGLRDDQIAKQVQNFRDQAYYDQAQLRLITGRDSAAELDKLEHDLTDEKGFYADKLDPDRRNALLNSVLGGKTRLAQQAEIAQAQAARQAEVRLNRAGHAYEAMTSIMDAGGLIDPAYVAQVSQQVAGTPYAAALDQAYKNHQATGGFAAQSLPAQRSALAAIDAEIATKGRNPQLDERRKQLTTIYENSSRAADVDPMGAAIQRGVITGLPALDLSSPTALASSLAARTQAADTVSAWAGRTVAPLRADELQSLQAGLDKAPTAIKLATFGALQQAMPPAAYLATMRQLAKDQPVVAALGALAAQGASTTEGRSVARLGFEGLTLIKDKTFLLPKDKAGADAMIPAFNLEVGTTAFIDEEQRNMAFDLTKAVYAKLSQDAGDNTGTLNTGRLRQAINLATGGITEHAGQTVVKPYGMADDTFSDRLQEQLRQLAADSKVPYSRIKDLPLVPTPDVSGEYYLQVGRDILRESGSTSPVRISVLKPGPVDPIRGTSRGAPR